MNHGSPARFILATVALGRSSVKDDVGQIVIDELRGRNVTLVRSQRSTAKDTSSSSS